MTTWAAIFFAGILIVSGLVTFPLPLPIGLPLIILGLSVLFRYSRGARRLFIKIVKGNPKIARIWYRLRKSGGSFNDSA